jgi:hypothetical protein
VDIAWFNVEATTRKYLSASLCESDPTSRKLKPQKKSTWTKKSLGLSGSRQRHPTQSVLCCGESSLARGLVVLAGLCPARELGAGDPWGRSCCPEQTGGEQWSLKLAIFRRRQTPEQREIAFSPQTKHPPTRHDPCPTTRPTRSTDHPRHTHVSPPQPSHD